MPADTPLGCGARWQGADVLLQVRVIPRASTDAVVPENDCIKVRLTAPPVEGQANAHLCKVLAKAFDVPKSRVSVERGTTSRVKQVRVAAPDAVPEFLRG